MVEIVREPILFRKSALFVAVRIILQKIFQKDQKIKVKSRVAGDLENRSTERTPWKCFRCGSEDNLISKYPKPPKNEKRQNQVRFNEKVNLACENSKNNNDQKIYASMARMSDNDKCSGRNFGDSSQLTNRILDFGATCHMTPEVSDFISGSLEDTDKHIKVAGGHHVTA